MPDLIVIGGGIIGLMTASEFSANGLSVCLIDRHKAGHQASWAAGGILSPLYPWRQPEAVNVLSDWSQSKYVQIAESLKQNTGIDPEWVQSGVLVSNVSDYSDADRWCEAHLINTIRPSSIAIQRLESNIRITCESPYYFPEIAQIRNPRLLQGLRVDLRQKGVKILEDVEVVDVIFENQRAKGVRTVGGDILSDHVVIAAGAWSKAICGTLCDLPIEPVKGQMILYKTEPGLLSTIVVDDSRYFIPRKDGHLLVGSTLERSGFDSSTTTAAGKELQDFACSRIPSLYNYDVLKHWAGLRPGTPSGVPFIGKHPSIGNLGINCGHYRNGIITAPASARLLADLVLGREPIVPPAPYALERRSEGSSRSQGR